MSIIAKKYWVGTNTNTLRLELAKEYMEKGMII